MWCYCTELLCSNEAFEPCSYCKAYVCHKCLTRQHLCRPQAHGSSNSKSTSTTSVTFSVATWNILAKSYCSSEQYAYCPRVYLDWSFRRQLVTKTLRVGAKNAPDIICFQEMEDVRWFETEMPKYDSIFIQRGGGKEDGCAIFWKKDAFERVEEFQPLYVHFNDLATRAGATKTDQVRMLRHNVGLAVALRPRQTSTPSVDSLVLVGTTHLYWNPLQEDVKLRQMAYFFQRLEAARESLLQSSSASRVPVQVETLICGDFNATPKTGLYSFVMNGAWHPSGGLNEEGFTKDMKSVKVLMDTGMHRVARWLRGIGVDAACWDESPVNTTPAVPEKGTGKVSTVETADGAISTCSCTPTCVRACTARPSSKALTPAQVRIQEMFNKARLEKRILITHSSKLIQRRNCPPYFLVSATGARAFKEIVEHFGLRYDPDAVYSRCTVCNGDLESATVEEMRKNPPAAFPAALLEKGVDEQGKPLEFFRCVESNCGQVFWWGPRSQLGAELLENKVDRVRTNSTKAPADTTDDNNTHNNNTNNNNNNNNKPDTYRKAYNPLLHLPREATAPADPTVPRHIKKGEFKRLYTLSPQKDEINTQNFITKDAARVCDGESCSVDIFVKNGPPPDTFCTIVKQALGNGTLIETLESIDRYYCVRKRDAPVTTPRPIKKGEFKQTYTLLPNKVEGSEGSNYATKEAKRVSDGLYFYVDIFSKPKRDSQPPPEFAVKVQQAVSDRDFVEALESADRLYCIRVSTRTGDESPPETKAAAESDEEEAGVYLESDFTGALSHSLSFYSAYGRSQGEPAFTNFTGNFRGCLDYIFAEPGLNVLSVRTLQTEAEASKHTAFPSEEWPSDHLLLEATFGFEERIHE